MTWDEALYYCETCNYGCKTKHAFDTHLKTAKHSRGGKPLFYDCILCNYTYQNKSVFKKHLLTKKHKNKADLLCKLCFD